MTALPPPATPVVTGLFRARTVLVYGEVDADLAERAAAQLFALAADDPDAPIRVVISSPGGHVESGDAIRDVLRFVPAPITVVGTGWVASAGALIFTAAPKERRFATPNTRFMLHQPLGQISGPAIDVEIEADQILAMRRRLDAIFAEATGQTPERIREDTDRNHWMTAAEAVDYGLVGRVVEHARELDD